MESKELRIGNLVNHGESYQNRYKNPLEISWMDFEDIDGLEPIPLTEEWLLRFGLNKMTRFGDNVLDIDIEKNEVWIGGCDSCTDDMGFLIKEIKYVHQLQNLYFALTNKELVWISKN